jgi:hypothetical protein
METVFVRLKPYNPKQGFVVQRYSYKGQSFVQDDSGRSTWYQVGVPYSREIAELRQEDNNPRSPALFDITTQDEYAQIVAREEDLRLVELGVLSPTMVQPIKENRTIDLTGKPGIGRSAAIPEPPVGGSPPVPARLAPAPVRPPPAELSEEPTPVETPAAVIAGRPRKRRFGPDGE